MPKKLVDAEGQLTGERNDVALAGLNHKCGWRGTTNTLLNFGEGRFTPGGQAGAVGYLVGQPGKGLACMFHMMNEARIGVGMAATMLGMAGYEASLAYARQRPQGRPTGPGGKDAAAPQVPIIQHADVKRMLLAQKSYAEGALALALYCARLVDEQHTGMPEAANEARLLLEVLTTHCQELAQRVVPGGQQPGHPSARRLWLYARLSGGAVLARQPSEHDSRGHARHPGHGPAGPQSGDGRRRRIEGLGHRDRADHRAVCRCAGTGSALCRAGRRLAAAGRSHPGRLGHR